MKILIYVAIAVAIVSLLGLFDRYMINKKIRENEDCRNLFKKPRD